MHISEIHLKLDYDEFSSFRHMTVTLAATLRP